MSSILATKKEKQRKHDQILLSNNFRGYKIGQLPIAEAMARWSEFCSHPGNSYRQDVVYGKESNNGSDRHTGFQTK